MKILILTHYFPPLNVIASHRPYGWARAWTELGHDVHVLTTEKYAFDGQLSLDVSLGGMRLHTVPYLGQRRNKFGGEEKYRNSARYWSTIKRHTHRLRQSLGAAADVRLLSVPALIRTGLDLATQHQFDFILSTYGPGAPHIAANRITSKTGIPWVADYQDLWTSNYAEPNRPLRDKLTAWIERRLIRRTAMIVTLSHGVAERLSQILHRDCIVAYFGYIDAVPAHINKPDSKFRLVYTGRTYPGRQSIEPLFMALKRVIAVRPDIGESLAIDFYGPEQAYLNELQERHGTWTVTSLHGEVAHETSLSVQQGANAVLFFDWSDVSSKGVLTGKLFEYLHSGKPIITINHGFDTEATDLVTACGGGVILQSEDDIQKFFLAIPNSLPLLSRDEDQINQLSCRHQGNELLAKIQKQLFGANALDRVRGISS